MIKYSDDDLEKYDSDIDESEENKENDDEAE